MPNYEFHGIDQAGKNLRGLVDAESEKAAKQKLRREGIYTTKIVKRGARKEVAASGDSRQRTKPAGKEKVKLLELAEVTRQLATLVKAKVPLVEALAALHEQMENQKFREIISHIKTKVNEGSSLAKAMREHPKVFEETYTSMIKAGEASGALEIVLLRLADFLDRSVKLRNKVKSSMVYPVILGVVSMAIVSGLLTFVVPKLAAIFQQQQKALPAVTMILIGGSSVFRDYWFVLLTVVVGGVYIYRQYVTTEKGRKWRDKKVISLPLFGTTMRKIVIARFARTLSTLLNSGVPLIQALDIVKEVVANVVIGESLEKVKVRVREGESLAKNLKASGHFPAIVTHMIAIGEKAGGKELEEMLENVAESYESDVENSLTSLTSIIEPIMIIALGGIIAFVVLAIILPVLQSTSIN